MLWLAGEYLKEEFQKWHKHTNRQVNLIDCWTASFAVKKSPQSQVQVSSTSVKYKWKETELIGCLCMIPLAWTGFETVETLESQFCPIG